MSKTYRIAFDRGINVVGDKSILPDGFATVLDNVDLRSGTPRPFKAPEYQFAAPATTTRSWEYRGRWFHSDNWQDHVGEYIGNIERVYTTEEGSLPSKTIEGLTVPLGTPIPLVPPSVIAGDTFTPAGVKLSVDYTGLGQLPDGPRYYRVAAVTADGVMPPSAPVFITVDAAALQTITTDSSTDNGTGITTTTETITTTAEGSSVDLEWGEVTLAVSYNIYVGDGSEQYFLVNISSGILTYRDTGNITASGDYASQYVQDQSFTYVYSYVRNVNGVYDESGLSSLSVPMKAAQGRVVTRDFLNDGYFNQTDKDGNLLVESANWSCPASAILYPPESLFGITCTYSSANSMVVFNYPAHGFSSGIYPDRGYFSGFSDKAWNLQTFDLIYIDADHFAIANAKNPSDGTSVVPSAPLWLYGTVTLPAGTELQLCKTTITYTSSTLVNDGDAVYIPGMGLVRASYLSASTFSVNVLYGLSSGTGMTWVPKNGYYSKWRLYRNEQGIWNLVQEVDIWKDSYMDALPYSALGGTPTSFYQENGQDVSYDTPPLGLMALESHYGMLFGISGHSVRWTPTLVPDAWPPTFSEPFPYQPTALASYGQGLIVLCEDAIYRIDGNDPTLLSVSKTMAQDGCFAPHSIQKTDKGLIYLGKRGICIFDGNKSECLTDSRVFGDTLTAPSTMPTPYTFWWMPTIMTRNYADLAGESSIIGSQYSFELDNTRVIEGYNKYIKSFYHLGKYYLFYTGDNFTANTAFVLDLQMPGMPLTTLGMKALDAHVDEFQNAYVLFDNASNLSSDPYFWPAMGGGDPYVLDGYVVPPYVFT